MTRPILKRQVRLMVTGRVQGVGFREFIRREAVNLSIDGWVRNRRDGTVEALIVGPEEAIDSLVSAAREGPPTAKVIDVQVADYAGTFLAGFMVLPTE